MSVLLDRKIKHEIFVCGKIHILKAKPCCVLEQVACEPWFLFACCLVQDGGFVYLTIQTFCWRFLFTVLTRKSVLYLNLQLLLMT